MQSRLIQIFVLLVLIDPEEKEIDATYTAYCKELMQQTHCGENVTNNRAKLCLFQKLTGKDTEMVVASLI